MDITQPTLPALNNLPPAPKALWHNYSQELIEDVIRKRCGIVSLCILDLECNYKQLYNAIDHYKLRDFLKEQKKQLLDKAEFVIYKSMDSENESIALKAAENVLKSKFASDEGWGNGNNINIAQQIVADGDKEIAIKNIFGIQTQEKTDGPQ